jgi:hypothetical protein
MYSYSEMGLPMKTLILFCGSKYNLWLYLVFYLFWLFFYVHMCELTQEND